MRMTKNASFLVGFNNWGKTRSIYDLFGRSRFYFGRTYNISSVNASFTVLSASNDDYSERTFIQKAQERINRSPDKGKNFFGALCPSREPGNDSRRILETAPFNRYEIHLMMLKYKWDFHAELKIEAIEQYLSGLSNIRFHVVNADSNLQGDSERGSARESQIILQLGAIYA